MTLEETIDKRVDKLDSNITALAKSRKIEQEKREKVEYWNAELETYLAAYPDRVALARAEEELAKLTEATKIIDESVRVRALDVYDLQNNKDVYESVSIAEYTTFEIDNKKAITWASEHHQKALKLDEKEIKKVAKAGMEVDGVIIGKENKVKIASDLSAYLDG